MQISQETVFHPAMGIGLTAGRLAAQHETAPRRTMSTRDDTRAYRCRDRQNRLRHAQDCAHIFQCA